MAQTTFRQPKRRVAVNDITGDEICTHYNSKEYVDGWERIWGKKEESKPEVKKED
jgi:hypothetical protein